MTQEGKLWIANLYSHVFAEEHKLPTLGAVRGRDAAAQRPLQAERETGGSTLATAQAGRMKRLHSQH
jgi:hypothetical protein